MPLYRDEAVVLRTHKLGEADRIVTLLTRYHGQVRAVAKGVRRTASKFGARLEPFMSIDVQLYEGRNLDTVSQVETLAAYGKEIIEDYAVYTSATVMLEAAEKLTAEESNSQQYLLLLGALRSMASKEHDAALILDAYLLRSLSIAGWAPNFESCVHCGATGKHSGFVLQLGGVVCESCKPGGAATIDEQTSQLLGALLSGQWQIADQSSQAARSAAAGIVAAYSQWHIERGLKSLQHLERT